MELLFPYHPRLVHFPIALGLAGAIFLAVGLFRNQSRWIEYGRFSLLLGWLGVLLAAASGLIDQSRAPNTPAVSSTINQHITVGIMLIVVLGLALYWPLRDRNLLRGGGRQRWAYAGLLALGVLLILIEAWLGGRLVYKLGVGVEPH